MNKEQLTALVAEILGQMEPQVKAGHYRPTAPEPQPERQGHRPGEFVPDVTTLDLRKLYLTEDPQNGAAFAAMKQRTPARLGSGRAGARYKTLTMLRFRADHAAAQDAVFSEMEADFAKKHDLLPVKTCCESKDQYLTRPDLGRRFDEVTQANTWGGSQIGRSTDKGRTWYHRRISATGKQLRCHLTRYQYPISEAPLQT